MQFSAVLRFALHRVVPSSESRVHELHLERHCAYRSCDERQQRHDAGYHKCSASRGVTLHFECTVLNGTSSVAVSKLTWPSGIIMSDADGASSDTYYTAGTLSQWLVSCPETTRYIELNLTIFPRHH